MPSQPLRFETMPPISLSYVKIVRGVSAADDRACSVDYVIEHAFAICIFARVRYACQVLAVF